MTEQLLKLPEKPGTVIAIGEWWLIRLRSYEGAPSAWELLPFPRAELTEHAHRMGVSAQCVYDDAWVLSEVEQEGGYLIISDPREKPSGIQYFAPADADPRTWAPGTRVTLYVNEATTWHGAIVTQVNVDETEVRWDHEPDPHDVVFPPELRREESGR